MLKTLGFLPRRGDLDRPAFRDYYERRHAPLALEHIRVFAKYVRNHVVAASPHEPPFDTASEFWFDDASSAKTVGDWLASPAGAVLRQDEANFMDRPRIAACAVEEHPLLGPARGVELGPIRKSGVLLLGGETDARTVKTWCDDIVARECAALSRAALDIPVSPLPAHLPLRAVLWLWPRSGANRLLTPLARPIGGATVLQLEFDAIETEPVRLRDSPP
jgi:uncharacterized protein (TIGR02118 family)